METCGFATPGLASNSGRVTRWAPLRLHIPIDGVAAVVEVVERAEGAAVGKGELQGAFAALYPGEVGFAEGGVQPGGDVVVVGVVVVAHGRVGEGDGCLHPFGAHVAGENYRPV